MAFSLIFSSIGMKEQSAQALFLTAQAYQNIDQFTQARQFYSLAFSRYRELNNLQKIGECALVLGIIYREEGDFKKIVEGCPVPLVIAGGPKLETEMDIFNLVYDAINAGAIGVDMGRNIWQNDHPIAMIKSIRSIVHENATAKEAYELFLKMKNNQ